jgi:hypothetical protein
MPDAPWIRASDADRDRAVAWLREHCVAGRLSEEERQERVAAALAAKTLGALGELMTDLPDLDRLPDAALHRLGPALASPAQPVRAARAGRPRAPLSEDAAAMACLSLIVVAYLATGLATGIWWIPWALLAVPAFRLMRRAEPPGLRQPDRHSDSLGRRRLGTVITSRYRPRVAVRSK